MRSLVFFPFILSICQLLHGCGGSFIESSMFRNFYGAKSELMCQGREHLSPFAFGDGSSANPFGICTAVQLNNIGANVENLSKHFILLKDIDLASFSSNDFNLIGDLSNAFSGVFNGNGKEIKNFIYNDTTQSHIGFFGRVAEEGMIKNVTFKSPNVTANIASAVVAADFGGQMENVKVLEAHLNVGEASGGLVGRSGLFGSIVSNPRFYQVEFKGEITAKDANTPYLGGIVGSARSTIMKGVVVEIDIFGGSSCGGVVGYGVFVLIDSVVKTNSTGKCSGVFGYGGGQFTNIDVETTVETLVAGGIGDYASGFAGAIYDENSLNSSLREWRHTHYKGSVFSMYETKDIRVKATINAPNMQAAGFIGHSGGSGNLTFSDIYVLEGSTIRGKDYVGGLFGRIEGGQRISNATITGVEIRGENYVGAAFGRTRSLSSGGIDNVTVSSSSVTGVNYVGGFVGRSQPTISGVINSLSCLNCQTSANVEGQNYVGGFAGGVDRALIEQSSASGHVQGSGDHVAGFIPNIINATVRNTYYAYGNISGNDKVSAFGHGMSNSTLENVFSSPASLQVNGIDFGIFALPSDTYNPLSESIVDSWYNQTTTGVLNLNAQELQYNHEISILNEAAARNLGAFGTWDSDIWLFEIGNYPVLH